MGCAERWHNNSVRVIGQPEPPDHPHHPAQPRRLRVSLFVPRADEPAATAAQFDFANLLKVRHFLNPSRLG